MKYEYMLNTWGGFYNDEHSAIHGHKDGYHYFNSDEEREEYLSLLKSIEQEMGAIYLASTKCEGYHTRTPVVAHRVIMHEGKQYYAKREFPPCYPISTVFYSMANSWYTGFNDYPLGEDFDYDAADIKIVQEWVTGAFSDGEVN